MASLAPGTTVTVSARDDGWELRSSDGTDGRLRGEVLELGDVTLRLRRTGSRYEFVDGTGVPMLRFDPAGRKAATLTTASARYRLARLRPRPLLHRWQLTRDVRGDALLRVQRTPLGTRVTVDGLEALSDVERTALVLGALAEVLDLVGEVTTV